MQSSRLKIIFNLRTSNKFNVTTQSLITCLRGLLYFAQDAQVAHWMNKIMCKEVSCASLRQICARLDFPLVNAQDLHKIYFFCQCAIYAMIYVFCQCTVYAHDLLKIFLLPMRNMCARYVQDSTSFANAQYTRNYFFCQCAVHAQNLHKILLILSDLG